MVCTTTMRHACSSTLLLISGRRMGFAPQRLTGLVLATTSKAAALGSLGFMGASAGDYSYIFLLSPCIGLGAVRRCSGKLRLYHLSNRSSYCRYNQSKTSNIGALMITYTILGVPYSNYSILGPETLFQLLRPLHYRTLIVALAVTLKDPL